MIVSLVTCKLVRPETLETFNPPVNVVAPPTLSAPVIVSFVTCKLLKPETVVTFNPPEIVVPPETINPALAVINSDAMTDLVNVVYGRATAIPNP